MSMVRKNIDEISGAVKEERVWVSVRIRLSVGVNELMNQRLRDPIGLKSAVGDLPGQAAYSASKFAVRGFSESLRHELEGSRIGVTVVHPGGVATSIAENARVPAGISEEEIARRRAKYRKLLRLPPEIAGETIVRGIERRERRILVGSDAKTISLIARLMPVSYWKLLTRRAGE